MLNKRRLLVGLVCIILAGCAGGIFGLQQPSSPPPVSTTPTPLSTITPTPTPNIQSTPTPSTVVTVLGPKITKITPDTGKAGDYVTIAGEKFSDKGNLILKRNDSTYDIKTATWNDERIVFTVPSELLSGVYQVIAKAGNSESNGMSFAVMSGSSGGGGGGGGGGGSSSYTPPTNPPATNPPTCSIISPTASANTGNPATIVVAASDNVAVTKVEIYEGATLLTTLNSTPYVYNWSTTIGSHTIKAKAYDASTSTESSAITFNLSGTCDTTGPTVAVTTPVESGNVTAPVSIAITATDAQTSVSRVELYDGTNPTPFTTLTTSPYNYSWSTSNGAKTLKVRAYDTCSNMTETTRNFTVSSGGSCALTGDISTPSDGANLTTTPFNVTATASGETVSKIELYDGASLLATLTTSPYTYSWTASNGGHSLKMKAYGTTCNFEHIHNITVNTGALTCGCSGSNLQPPNITGITTDPVKDGPTNTVTLPEIGSTVLLTASGVSDPDGCPAANLCYRWFYKPWGGNWTSIAAYSNSSSTYWTTPSVSVTTNKYEVKCELYDGLYVNSVYVNVLTPQPGGTGDFWITPQF